MKELLSNYGPLDMLWFDGGEQNRLGFGGDWKGAKWAKRQTGQSYTGGFSWQHDQVHTMLRKLQPNVVINGRADMPEDFRSREGWNAVGDFDDQHPWELCVPMAGAWGYQPNMKPNPLKDYIQLLAKVAGRDGNLLMNVGPAPDSQMDPAQVSRLREIGDWLGQYGQSIYNTRGGPFLPSDWGASTHRGSTIYVHVLTWPNGKLTLPAIAAKVIRATALTGGKASFGQSEHGIEISVPEASRSDIDTVVELQLDAPLKPYPFKSGKLKRG